MHNTIFIGGQAAVTLDKENKVSNIQFLPDDDMALVQLRNGSFDYIANASAFRKSHKANSTLLRKAAHGRLSATRDEAIQLTLKVFKREGLDVRETLLREAVELIDNVKL